MKGTNIMVACSVKWGYFQQTKNKKKVSISVVLADKKASSLLQKKLGGE
jgi:hypothetical protein